MSTTTTPYSAPGAGAASAVSSAEPRDRIAWRLIGASDDGMIDLGDEFDGELWVPRAGGRRHALLCVDVEGGAEVGDLVSFELRARDAETRFIDSPVIAVSTYRYGGTQFGQAAWDDRSLVEHEWQAEAHLYEPVSSDITLEELTALVRGRLRAPGCVTDTVNDAVMGGEGGYFPQDNGVAVAVEAR